MEQKNAVTPGARPVVPSSQAAPAKSSGGASLFSVGVIVVGFIVSYLIYKFLLGDPSHFLGNNPENNPKPGDYLGIVYKGGPIVPILLTMFLCVIVFSIERSLTIGKAKGSSSIEAFVRSVRQKLNVNDISGAIALCDQQKGSVANVVRAGLKKYQEMGRETTMNTDQRVLAIQKEI